MLKYIIKRILYLIPVLVGITLLIYLVLSLSPIDPVSLRLGSEYTYEQWYAMSESMGLNKPLLMRYLTYLINIFRGDFGRSWFLGINIAQELAHRIPYSLLLGAYANVISIVIGIPLGIIAGVRHNKPTDFILTFFALLLASAPGFWLGMLGQIFISLNLGLLPVSGVGSLAHFTLPAIVLGGALTASNLRTTRTWLIDVIRSDYVRTARAKGANEFRVVLRHALSNSLLPVITTLGFHFAMIMGTATVIETVFAIPGSSSFMINAVRTGDVPIVMGCIAVVALYVGIINLLIDLLYAAVDPRVKLN